MNGFTLQHKTLYGLLVGAMVLIGCSPGASGGATPTLPPVSPTVEASATPQDTATPAPTPTETMDVTLPEISQRYDVGGFELYLACRGGIAGAPTVLFEASAGAPGSDPEVWGTLPDVIGAQARVCVYDRAGLGQSDPSLNEPRTARAMAAELDALLTAAGEQGPYLIVAHSLGGLIARAYAYSYLDKVVGMVLLDTTHEEFADFLQTVMAPDEFAAYQEAVLSGLELDMTITREEIAESKAAIEYPLGDLPLTVIARGVNAPRPGLSEEELAERLVGWQGLQMTLAEESTQGQFLIAEGSGHFIHLEQPEIAIEAIEAMLEGMGQAALTGGADS